MKVELNSIEKNIISIVAALNIIVMLIFQYGLPSVNVVKEDLYQSGKEAEESEVGTIEAVEQESAEKEAKAVEDALARGEAEDTEQDVDSEEERDPDAPILELTDDHIYLKVGDRFNYMSYIKTMEDVDGSDLSHYIYLDKDVDTSQPGEIELTYRITSVITGKSDSKVLLITIQE